MENFKDSIGEEIILTDEDRKLLSQIKVDSFDEPQEVRSSKQILKDSVAERMQTNLPVNVSDTVEELCSNVENKLNFVLVNGKFVDQSWVDHSLEIYEKVLAEMEHEMLNVPHSDEDRYQIAQMHALWSDMKKRVYG